MGKIDKWMMLLFGLVGGWLIATFPGWVDAWAKEHWWNIATAFGTVGATAAAVVVPLYQNWDRRREQHRERLKVEWALAEEVFRISYLLREIGKSLQSSLAKQSVTEIGHFQAQLNAAKAATTDRVGRMLIDDLLRQAVHLHDEVTRRAAGVSSLSATADALGKRPMLNDELRKSIDSLPALYDQSLRWLERVIGSLEVEGIVTSSVFRSSGKAVMKMHATGDGRVKNEP